MRILNNDIRKLNYDYLELKKNQTNKLYCQNTVICCHYLKYDKTFYIYNFYIYI